MFKRTALAVLIVIGFLIFGGGMYLYMYTGSHNSVASGTNEPWGGLEAVSSDTDKSFRLKYTVKGSAEDANPSIFASRVSYYHRTDTAVYITTNFKTETHNEMPQIVGGDAYVIPTADSATFNPIRTNTSAGDVYAKDKNYVYKDGKIIRGANPATFVPPTSTSVATNNSSSNDALVVTLTSAPAENVNFEAGAAPLAVEFKTEVPTSDPLYPYTNKQILDSRYIVNPGDVHAPFILYPGPTNGSNRDYIQNYTYLYPGTYTATLYKNSVADGGLSKPAADSIVLGKVTIVVKDTHTTSKGSATFDMDNLTFSTSSPILSGTFSGVKNLCVVVLTKGALPYKLLDAQGFYKLTDSATSCSASYRDPGTLTITNNKWIDAVGKVGLEIPVGTHDVGIYDEDTGVLLASAPITILPR